MAPRQSFHLGTTRTTSTPIRRVPANGVLRPRATRLPSVPLGHSFPVNRSNPTSPAGVAPHAVGLLQVLTRRARVSTNGDARK